ncbi:MAG TPA: hypothetical protein G4O00_12715 [Thermoflexia bacterium]|nr:hypothetical protein [Thermoflexia bacterium]
MADRRQFVSNHEERDVAHRLGIPDDAERVLVFTESSHWDPNWLFTSEEYFERFVRRNLDRAIAELRREPRRVYSIECVFFLRMYWDRCPAQRDIVRDLVNAGRLRLTHSGVTTADTLLPSAEAILRDWLIGQEWLRTNGMEQEPTLAYFADSFGCTPALPSLLNAAGFDRAAITRVDGMYFPGCDLEPPTRFPRPGSSAERLLLQERTLDFVWRDGNGGEVLCHWNAFTYGQGDMLAHVGLSRVYLARLALSLRSDRHIARRIHRYVAQLAPYSRTRYMLCPIGFDFVEPIPDLVALLDRYNRNHYPTTGIWVVNAGLDDYLTLVETHRAELPVLELDPNPYWTGFYTARPTLKQRCRRLVDALLVAEQLLHLPGNRRADGAITRKMQEAWWQAVVSNHHDFITGTSPDQVVDQEQIPWLDQAAGAVEEVVARLAPSLPVPHEVAARSRPPTWRREDGQVQIETAYYHVTLSEEAGGAIVQLRDRETGALLLTDASNDLVGYRDSGGLWRMGYEFAGGIWRESRRASRRPARVRVLEREGALEIMICSELEGETFRRRMWLDEGSPVIHFRVEGRAAEGRTVVARFATTIAARTLLMDTPGGVVTRPLTRIYDPTFWPLHRFVWLQDEHTGWGLAVFQPLPGAVSYRPDGRLELVAMRNAVRERILGLIPIPAHPASGHERERYACEYALLFTTRGGEDESKIHTLAHAMDNSPWDDPRSKTLRTLARSVVTTGTPDVWVAAVKPASRGKGTIVRLNGFVGPGSPVVVASPYFTVTAAWLSDARERDIEPLEVHDGTVRVTMPGTIATIRLELTAKEKTTEARRTQRNTERALEAL